ncbi:MAG TPA: capsular polysaccharide biosynthesis protein CapF [Clostridia bacterium]|nr:capsular polysaccharide biosynthesis protein CapF [Clostridia bacterium]
MKILITGAKGFIGQNLTVQLRNQGYYDLYEFDLDTEPSMLDVFCRDADFVFHLAGVNRPKVESEFMEGNFGFTTVLLESLKRHANKCPVMISSSAQAALDNPYGRSKKAGEDLAFAYSQETGANVLVYRFPNVFGKWCRPNYNSVVATFCHNIARNLPITINDENAAVNLVYIDDVVAELINALNGKGNQKGMYYEVQPVYSVTVGRIAELVYSFIDIPNSLMLPDLADDFIRKLHSTYLSYLPPGRFGYPLKSHTDHRGSFTEFIKTLNGGQMSVNVSKPGVVKGNHWHNTKNEKFLVVSGKGIIRLRQIHSDEVIEYRVSGDNPVVVDIPAGYTHNIENLGDTDMVTVMWANECFDPEKPDTYYMEV